MELSIGDLVWVKNTVVPSTTTKWKLGFVVDDSDYTSGMYKIHILEFGMIQNHFIADIRILEQKTTIYENRREAK